MCNGKHGDNMIYMTSDQAKKIITKPFGAEIPPVLIEDFVRAAIETGLQKKWALASAVFAFVSSTLSQRREWYDGVYRDYCQQAPSEDKVVQAGERVRKAARQVRKKPA